MTNPMSAKQQENRRHDAYRDAWTGSEDDLAYDSGTETADADPFEDMPDVGESMAECMLPTRVTCLPCMTSNLKCDKALPTCGSCKRLNVKCCRVGNVQDTGRKETNGIMKSPLPVPTHFRSDSRVNRSVAEAADGILGGKSLTLSALLREAIVREVADHQSLYTHEATTHQSDRSLHPFFDDKQDLTKPNTQQCTLSDMDESSDQHKNLEQAESHPVEVSSSAGQSPINIPKFVGFSSNPASPSARSKSESHREILSETLSKASPAGYDKTHNKVIGVSSNQDLDYVDCQKATRRCIHDVKTDHIPLQPHFMAAPTSDGRGFGIHAATQQPLPYQTSSDIDAGYGKGILSTASKDQVLRPLKEQSSSRGQSQDSFLQTRNSHKKGMTTRLSAASSSQPNGSEDSEDSDPPVTFKQKSKRNVKQTKASTPSPVSTVSRHTRGKTHGDMDIDSSDSDAPIIPSWKRSARRLTASSANQRLESDEAESSENGNEDQNSQVSIQSVDAYVMENSKFGIRDIMPKADTQDRRPLTLYDIVPGKTQPQQESRLPQHIQDLNEFHDALRICFAPFLAGPDWIIRGPARKRKFTLADVTGTGSQEPLFSVEYAIEQYKAFHGYQEDQASEQIIDPTQDEEGATATEHRIASNAQMAMIMDETNSIEERPTPDKHNASQPSDKQVADSSWTGSLEDTENLPTGDEDMEVTTTEEASNMSSESCTGRPAPLFPGAAITHQDVLRSEDPYATWSRAQLDNPRVGKGFFNTTLEAQYQASKASSSGG